MINKKLKWLRSIGPDATMIYIIISIFLITGLYDFSWLGDLVIGCVCGRMVWWHFSFTHEDLFCN